MDFPTIISWVYLCAAAGTCILAIGFLLLVFIYRRQCSNFETILFCNTAVGSLMYSSINCAVAYYLILFDRQQTDQVDSLCSVRAYIHHCSVACVHHSIVLQTIHKYCKVKRISILNSNTRRICLILGQWIFDFGYILPALLTNNIVQVPMDNMCLLSLSKPAVIICLGGITFFLSDAIIFSTYRDLVKYVLEISKRAHGIQKAMLHRDLIVTRRIVLLNASLAILGIPPIVIMILAATRTTHFPYHYFRVVGLISSVSMLLVTLFVFWITPNIREIIFEKINRFYSRSRNTVVPLAPRIDSQRF